MRMSTSARRVICSEQRTEETVVDLRIEQRRAESVGGEHVRVGARQAPNEAVEAQTTEVVSHGVRGVGAAEQAGDEGTQTPIVEAGDGMHRQTQGAGQSHDA